MPLRSLLLIPLFVACGEGADSNQHKADDTAPPDCTPLTWYPDDDGDGWGADDGAVEACEAPSGFVDQGGDCDDDEPEVHPEAEELCNGRDDDCDGLADDGVLLDWYPNSDGDGWGDDDSWVQDCASPGDDWVNQGGDCDETNPEVHPGAEEICDGDDDDCDGRADQGEVGTWYSDDDGDGWGDDDSATETCDPEVGWVDVGGDCDPAEATVFPGADEDCNEVDDDCDGDVDEGFDADGDGWWDTSCSHLEHTDCDDADPDLHPQAAEICDDGLDQDCDGYDSFCHFEGSYPLSDAHALRWSTDVSGDAGRIVRTADLDQDGFDDVLTASLYVGVYLGGVWLNYGPLSGETEFGDDGVFLAGTMDAKGGGRSLSAGDVNGDGYPDVGVGAPWGNLPGLYINYSPGYSDMSLDYADVVLWGDPGGHMGHGSALKDVTGDGIADGLVASYAVSGYAGAAYVVYGPLTADAEVTVDAAFNMSGENPHDYMGRVIEGGGDVNGDGVGDLLVPSPRANIIGYYTGCVYLVHGPPAGSYEAGDADAKLIGENANAAAGSTLAMADVSGDGYDDIVVGAYGTTVDGESSGAAYVAFGPITGEWSLADVDVTIYGERRTNFSTGLTADDIDGDGRAEVFAGANYADGSDDNSGAAYLFYGLTEGSYEATDAAAKILGTNTDDGAGQGVALGDIDGDGRGDLIVGANTESTGASRAGAMYVLYPEVW